MDHQPTSRSDGPDGPACPTGMTSARLSSDARGHPPNRLPVRAPEGATGAGGVGYWRAIDHAEPFLRGDEVVGVLGVVSEVDLYPVHSAGENAAVAAVVVADG